MTCPICDTKQAIIDILRKYDYSCSKLCSFNHEQALKALLKLNLGHCSSTSDKDKG
ncbi:hypothetical protein LCGC14_1716200 [marine sediment metagenome]|uniref:Uncharacterized protein n=1 Tax=marine sediment metagenome TaxID=412755 RepID=A0A0F9I1C3_9ZZZZ